MSYKNKIEQIMIQSNICRENYISEQTKHMGAIHNNSHITARYVEQMQANHNYKQQVWIKIHFRAKQADVSKL